MKKSRADGRGGKATGGPGVAARCLATLQAILGHAKHKGLLAEHPTKGAKKLAGNKKTRRLSVAEIEALGKAIAYAEQQGVSPTGIAVIRLLLLTGYRREEGQSTSMKPSSWPYDGHQTRLPSCSLRGLRSWTASVWSLERQRTLDKW
nr:hypothetical protein [Sphingobium sp. SCG-1]